MTAPIAIRNFSVGPLRGLIQASAENLGNLVVISGANGAGKSSLLDLLRAQRHVLAEPGTEVMFVGPHRTWRSSRLNRVSVYGFTAGSYGDLLMADAMPSFQYSVPPGLQGLQGMGRQSSSADDVQAFVKTSLVRLRDQQQALVTDAWQAQGKRVEAGTVPELFEPFARLVETLLPHLAWVGVTEATPDNIECLFRPASSTSATFDIDELSSGEKAAIALLLPLVERQVQQLIAPQQAASTIVPLTMLLDEPELHLHPLLQLQMLEYMRGIARDGIAQFILTTHSTTLLDALTDDELWLLSPAALRPQNQLGRLSTSAERLEVARTLTGSTHVLTRAKPIVFVEGEADRSGVASDARLMTLAVAAARSWALVPSRAKADVIAAVQRLRHESLDLPGMPVFGLVDADRDAPPATDHVMPWPVAMIENLLLDAGSICAALAPFGAQTGATSPAVVEALLQDLVIARADEEVQLRVRRRLPIGRVVLDLQSTSSPAAQAAAQAAEWAERVEALDLPAATTVARAEVEAVLADGHGLERFHGKRLLRGVYDGLHVQSAGISQSAFALAVAAHAAGTERVVRLTRSAVDRIRLYFPPGLPQALAAVPDPAASSLSERCAAERAAWEQGSPEPEQREDLRAALFAQALTAPEPIRQTIVSLASEIGTP